MKNVLKLLAESVLIPLALTAAVSATDLAIQKKIQGSGTTELIMSNGEMENVIKLVKCLEETFRRQKMTGLAYYSWIKNIGPTWSSKKYPVPHLWSRNYV